MKGDPCAGLAPLVWFILDPFDKSTHPRLTLCSLHLHEIDANLRRLYDDDFSDAKSLGTSLSIEDISCLEALRTSLKAEQGKLSVALR